MWTCNKKKIPSTKEINKQKKIITVDIHRQTPKPVKIQKRSGQKVCRKDIWMILNKSEFSSKTVWSWIFLFWEVFNYWSVSLLIILCWDFLFLHDSLWVGCVYPRIYPFPPGCPMCWHVTVHSGLQWSLLFLWCKL